MTKRDMTSEEKAARRLARALSTHEMPDQSPLHAALIAARTEQDAQLVARIAALAGVSIQELEATHKAARAAAGTAMERTPADA